MLRSSSLMMNENGVEVMNRKSPKAQEETGMFFEINQIDWTENPKIPGIQPIYVVRTQVQSCTPDWSLQFLQHRGSKLKFIYLERNY